jgi:hypothetical protein
MVNDLRQRLAEVADVLAALDARLAADDAEQLPGLAMARLGVDLAAAAARFQRHAEALGAGARENWPP